MDMNTDRINAYRKSRLQEEKHEESEGQGSVSMTQRVFAGLVFLLVAGIALVNMANNAVGAIRYHMSTLYRRYRHHRVE